ncbi:MAG TPA: DUF1460 domain-containing protein [Syntrophorhabdaceae bacterium]|nr:DUF1460 domain-containing protein [Syntrophorhabdaceae bacterium]HOL06127.1 DUF1460 domain-containing protein [Syntrophorhabdaceae bacterium]HPP41522.1 DUF1460 domain-containing protein [Syntrophorhabdaceae bacterium]
MVISLGKWTPGSLDKIISDASRLPDSGKKIGYISGLFIGTPYADNTLKGGVDEEEELVVNLNGVDCFTFIDYVEAMRLSSSFEGFLTYLRRIRYRDGFVEFRHRNHFFTDWAVYNSDFVEDITGHIGREKAIEIEKILNLRGDGSFFVPGIDAKKRRLIFIPSQDIDRGITEQLMTGDYIGLYSNTPGLDVSHVGIVIRDGKSLYLRHASSREKHRSVMDEDFTEYVKTRDGLIVLRPR